MTLWHSLQQLPPFVFLKQYETLFAGLAVVSAAMFVVSLLFVPLLLIWLPADYFQRDPSYKQANRGPLGWAVLVLKNIVGAILLLAGIAMLLLPGQGIISILAGLSLMNFPGKQRLEKAIVSRPSVLKSINWMRARAGKEDLRT